MAYLPGCPTPTASTTCVCGLFEEPTVPDEGRAWPKAVKISCEAPALPPVECGAYTTVYTPDRPGHPFSIYAPLYDESCVAVVDEDGNEIVTVI